MGCSRSSEGVQRWALCRFVIIGVCPSRRSFAWSCLDKSYISQAIEASTHMEIMTVLLADIEHNQLPTRVVPMLMSVLRQMAEEDGGVGEELDSGDGFSEMIFCALSLKHKKDISSKH